MDWSLILDWSCFVLLVVSLMGGWLLTMLGLWGNWIILAAALLYRIVVSADFVIQFGWWLPGAILALALIGEFIEFVAAALGAQKAGASRRAAVLSLIGSLIGALSGLSLGNLVLPVMGAFIGSLLLGSLGALVGTMIGEKWKGKDLSESFQSGRGAFAGRLLGTLGKSLTATGIVCLCILALIF